MDYITLSNGVKMPQLGYGVFQVTQEECERCVLDALKAGYRAIDTAQSYYNEEQVGAAIEENGVDRKDIFLTTKVWIEHYGYEKAKASVLDSMEKLRTDYLDLCLLHQRIRIITGHGGHWKNYTKKEKFVPLVYLIFILTVWWIFAPFPALNRW